jgi:putative DNA primase/helicase
LSGSWRSGWLSRFRDVADTGGGICNTCGSFANGFALLMWINGWDFGRAIREVAEQVGSRSRRPSMARSERESPTTRFAGSSSIAPGGNLSLSHPSAEPARLYLARRGLSVKVPDTLRFHAALGYYADNRLMAHYPALIAQVTGQGGEAVTIHRTYLTPDGRKAPVDAPKKLMRHPWRVS